MIFTSDVYSWIIGCLGINKIDLEQHKEQKSKRKKKSKVKEIYKMQIMNERMESSNKADYCDPSNRPAVTIYILSIRMVLTTKILGPSGMGGMHPSYPNPFL